MRSNVRKGKWTIVLKLFKNLHISVKLSIMMVLIFSVLVTSTVLITATSIRSLSLQTSQQRVKQEIDLIRHRFDEAEHDLLQHAQLYAATPNLASAVAHGDPVTAKASLLSDGIPSEREYIEAVDLNGTPIVSVGRSGTDLDSRQKEAILATVLRQGVEMTRTIPGEATDQAELWLAAIIPLRDSSGALVGVLLTSRQIDFDFLADINFAREDVHLMVVRDGQIVAHDLPLSADQMLSHDDSLPVEARGVRTDVILDSEGRPVVIYEGQRVLIHEGQIVNPGDSLVRGNPEEYFVFLIEEDAVQQALSGETVIAKDLVYGVSGIPPTRIGYTPLTVGGDTLSVLVVLLRQDELFAFRRDLTNNSTRVFALLALLALGIVVLFTQQTIVAPLGKLRAVAKRMANGDYSQRAVVDTSDEIDELARAFNEMAGTVQKREIDLQNLTDSLERQVEERTRELTQTNKKLQLEIAERKWVEEQIRELNEALEQRVMERTAELEAANEHLIVLTRIKDEFISNVSHELRTPISSIKLHHRLLELNPVRQEIYMARLKRETNRLARIIEDLLQLSRLDQNQVTVSLAPVDLNLLAAQYVADRTPLADDHKLSLVLDSGPDVPPVQADEGLIGQALSILLTNALNYTPADGTVVVSTHARRSDHRLWAGFSVSDSGPGISEADQEQLFKRFWRGKAGYETGAPGTGLGLAIAKEIVDRHHGRIEVSGKGVSGKGVTFTVWLKADEPEAQ